MLWCKLLSRARPTRTKKKKEALTKTSALLLKLEGTKFFGTVLLQRECHWKQWDCDKTECVQQQLSPLRQFMVSQQRAVVWPDISQQETLTHTRRGADRNLIGLLQSVTQLLADLNKEGFFSLRLYTSVTVTYTNKVNIILLNADI